MSTILIKIENATFRHRNSSFYENFNWTVKKGEHWVITGNVGAGKTSLVHALSGKYYAAKGKVGYPFLESGNGSSYELRRKLIRVVSFKDDSRIFSPNLYFYQQRFNAFAADGTLTVWEYLMNAGFDERMEAHVNLIKKTGIFPLLDLERIKLSSGQSRRLLITKAILQKPKILIIDNPYLGLDAPSRNEFNKLLEELVHTEELQLILAGQYEQLPACMTHRLHLEDFKIKKTGRIDSFLKQQDDKNPIAQKETELLQVIKKHYPAPTLSIPIIFDLKNVKVAYYGTEILKNINWQVKQGEKWALYGHNGSGKSTILALLFGDHPQAYANDIYLFGQKRGMGQNIWDIKKNTGFTSPELHYFFSYELTCLQAVITGLFDHVYLKRVPSSEERKLIDLFFDYFNISPLKEQSFQAISTGEQRIILLIRALIKNPPLLLLDEPFQGLDAVTIYKAKHLLSTILSDKHSLIFISHYKKEIPSCVQQVAYLEDGVLK